MPAPPPPAWDFNKFSGAVPPAPHPFWFPEAPPPPPPGMFSLSAPSAGGGTYLSRSSTSPRLVLPRGRTVRCRPRRGLFWASRSYSRGQVSL